MELDRVEFFIESLKESIQFKIKPYAPPLLREAYCLASNFEWHERVLDKSCGPFNKQPSGFSFQRNVLKSLCIENQVEILKYKAIKWKGHEGAWQKESFF